MSRDRRDTDRQNTGWAEQRLKRLNEASLLRTLEMRSSPQDAQVMLGSEAYINFSSNDYLGLANDARIVSAAIDALQRYGMGAGASRLLLGDTEAHRRLEVALADWLGTEAALIFNTGYAANMGVLTTIAGPEDLIFSDALNHASIIDGCRLARAEVRVYPHADVQALSAQLSRAEKNRRLIIVTESIFSMDGDRAPLSALVELADQHDATLIVDEAHAVGVLGPCGIGLAGELGLENRVDIRIGTLGKAFGVFGAFVATSRPIVDLLINRARPFVFSTALPPSVCAAAEQALSIVRTEPNARACLFKHIDRMYTGLASLGLVHGPNQRTPIFSVVLGEAEAALQASARLRAQGFLVKPIRPPTVPAGTSRLRISLSASHSEQALRGLLQGLAA